MPSFLCMKPHLLTNIFSLSRSLERVFLCGKFFFFFWSSIFSFLPASQSPLPQLGRGDVHPHRPECGVSPHLRVGCFFFRLFCFGFSLFPFSRVSRLDGEMGRGSFDLHCPCFIFCGLVALHLGSSAPLFQICSPCVFCLLWEIQRCFFFSNMFRWFISVTLTMPL